MIFKKQQEKERIANLLRKALLQNGEMDYGLFEYELEEHIDYWYEGLKADHDEFVFVVTENSGHVAMALITPEKKVFVNEEAREMLRRAWPMAYDTNMKFLIPKMAENLVRGFIAVNGVKTMR